MASRDLRFDLKMQDNNHLSARLEMDWLFLLGASDFMEVQKSDNYIILHAFEYNSYAFAQKKCE